MRASRIDFYRYEGRTIFDLVLPHPLAEVPVTAKWLAGLGNGGMCLNCAFGKGV